MTQSITGRAALLATTLVLAGAGVATAAFVGLPADGTQVNDDPAAGIDPHQDAGISDVTGGSLAGAARVPWATFEQKSGDAQLIFVRAFQKGGWVTQGHALNLDPTVEAEAPSIDFAGAKRTVPWDAWYEPSKALGGVKQIFASRFCATPNAICPAGGTWVPEGQDRGSGTPSLNINTDREAENPSVAGGAAVAGNDPVPWVAWQEQDGRVSGQTRDQIFVSKGVKQAMPHASCAGFKPSSAATVSSFCWQQVGADRLARDDGSSATGDPTLNVDPTRNGIEPDVTFTGKSDTVGWTVWYETGPSALGLRGNEQVFAAKIVADKSPGVDGGFHWQAVGNGTASQVNPLDTSAGNHFGPCAASQSAEDACALNADPGRDAEDPRVATGPPTPGTLTTGTPTVPWVVWAEDAGNGRHGIFVSRLVGGTHFELMAGGRPISNRGHDATTPDLTFFRNTPYVSWVESVGSTKRGFVGHFEPSGAFTLDTPGGLRQAPGSRKVALIDFRVPISSSCTSDPFTADGTQCPGGAPDAPFFVFTRASHPQALFAEAAGPCVVIVGCTATVTVSGQGATIQGALGTPAPVGILVKRRSGRHLRTVGKVPLGRHHRGRLRIRWNLRVHGRRLARGRYVVTLRAFDRRRRRVIATSSPVVVRVRR